MRLLGRFTILIAIWQIAAGFLLLYRLYGSAPATPAADTALTNAVTQLDLGTFYYLICYLSFQFLQLLWAYRVARELNHGAADDLRISGWYLLLYLTMPIINLAVPYLVAKKIFRSTAAGTDWRTAPVPVKLRLSGLIWGAGLLAAPLLGPGLSHKTASSGQLAVWTFWHMGLTAICAGAVIATLAFIKKIDQPA
ncbi:DUF4328 domain-containing protein [Granulosicoccaceae sp. 1_MG-2023]|nr:DUF4328 domain-containing protein [Granulosicoccaceae sp. 1_MG-2023]